MTGPSWPELLRTADAELCVEHAFGHPYAPDSPDGALALRVFADGRLHLTRRRLEHTQAWTARVHPGSAAKLFRRLAAAGVPDLPAEPFGPGPSRRFIVLTVREHRVVTELSRDTYEREPAWQRIFSWFDGVAERIRDRPLHGDLARSPAVSEVVQVDG